MIDWAQIGTGVQVASVLSVATVVVSLVSHFVSVLLRLAK